jgi:lipid-binding SYLF domain-containing protein
MKQSVSTIMCNTVLGIGLCLTGMNYAAAAGMGSQEQTEPEQASSAELQKVQNTVREAAQVIDKMSSKPEAKAALDRSRAVFVVPSYARASFIVGGAAGRGVLVGHEQGKWSAPAFYNVGTINAGAEAGAEGGSIAFLIMTDKALRGFEEGNNLSLNADTGLTVVNFSEWAQASVGKGGPNADVVVWSDTKGLYGAIAVNVTDIFWDKAANQAYYGRQVAIADILNGSIKDPMSQSPLRSEFSALEKAE